MNADKAAASVEKAAASPGWAMRTPLFWGFAEASFFVLIPDIAIGFVALFAGLRAGLKAAGWAILGAVAGGLMVALWPHAWQSFFPLLPGITEPMMERASSELAEGGWTAVVAAPTLGIPYKLYAAEWALQDKPLWQLVLVTPVARAWRFLGAALVAGGLHHLLRLARLRAPLERFPWVFVAIYVGYWVLTYVVYFRFVAATY